MNLNIKSVFLCPVRRRNTLSPGAAAGRSLTSPPCCRSGDPRAVVYRIQSAVMGVTRLLANEWAKHNINVNAIAPGYMATNNTQQLRADEQRSSEILDRIPAGRWGYRPI